MTNASSSDSHKRHIVRFRGDALTGWTLEIDGEPLFKFQDFHRLSEFMADLEEEFQTAEESEAAEQAFVDAEERAHQDSERYQRS